VKTFHDGEWKQYRDMRRLEAHREGHGADF
jgi:hypothetical protein